jgi:hypothetical protein
MQKEAASACVGTGCGIAHIASTVKVRGDGPLYGDGNDIAFLRTLAGEGDRWRTRGVTGVQV